MSTDGSADRREDPPPQNNGSGAIAGIGGGNGVVPGDSSRPFVPSQRLRLNPNKDHKPDSYDDLQLDFNPAIFSALERYLPPSMLSVSREAKMQFMREILLRYLPQGERTRAQRHREYRQKIISNYQPLHRELYAMHPATFFAPQFLKAINDNTEESFRSIMSEPSPGVYTFEMFQPHFCELLLYEVENFENWVNEVKFRIMRPNTMNKFGAVLDDFGLETMLDKLMEGFVRPISKVFFPEVGGSTLDSHHGFVVEYGKDRDVDLGFHVDDSEVTLNVCLGKEFSGGELFFRGTRCDKHVNTGSQSEEIFDYSHVPGKAVLHRGRHRHGARATTSGHRINLLLWCRRYIQKKKNRLEHQRLNALVYVRYNTRLRERSLQRKQNVDPILVEEIDSDDEWIAEKEDPLLPLDLCWLQDDELFIVDAIRVVSSGSQQTQASSDHMVSSHSFTSNDINDFLPEVSNNTHGFSLPVDQQRFSYYSTAILQLIGRC